jgi:hypothetical protein
MQRKAVCTAVVGFIAPWHAGCADTVCAHTVGICAAAAAVCCMGSLVYYCIVSSAVGQCALCWDTLVSCSSCFTAAAAGAHMESVLGRSVRAVAGCVLGGQYRAWFALLGFRYPLSLPASVAVFCRGRAWRCCRNIEHAVCSPFVLGGFAYSAGPVAYRHSACPACRPNCQTCSVVCCIMP